jgi:uncharacterized protein
MTHPPDREHPARARTSGRIANIRSSQTDHVFAFWSHRRGCLPPVARGYAGEVRTVTAETESLRAAIERCRPALEEILHRYGARNPRLFGSVARGDAGASSDVDVLVDLDDGRGNPLLRVAGIGEEFSRLLGVRVDVVAASLLREPVSATARVDAVPL